MQFKTCIMRNQNKLLIEQLDRKLKPFRETSNIQVPDRGWIHSIRKTLNMTLKQLGYRLNITSQGVKNIEEREATGSISLKSLKEVGKALDMKFVYGFVPNESSIEKLVELKARQLAKKIVLRTSHNMELEDQGNSQERINMAIDELTSDLQREMHKSLWD